MYAIPQSFKSLIRELKQISGLQNDSLIRQMVQVELTLTLATLLGLDDTEPITIGWVLLSRMPLYDARLERLTDEQRRMWANASLIVPLSSRFAWENALVRYAKDAPPELRLYEIQPLRLDNQMIYACRLDPCPDPLRVERYEAILSETLPFEKRKATVAAADKTYTVRVTNTNGEKRTGRVKITEGMLSKNGTSTWFDPPRPRAVISLQLQELFPTAEFLDNREKALGGRVHWVNDLGQIRFRKAVRDDERIYLEDENTVPLHLDGMVHLPGMVSAGKTTLAKLIIAHCIRMKWDVRITLVVGDSHTATETANQFNNWFCDGLDSENVVAVPILGVSQREVHLKRLHDSREYAKSVEKNRMHWGERWLMPVCPLAAKIQWDNDPYTVIRAGSEPCERLMDEPPPGKGRKKRHLCPLFHRCPSKQMYRDMPPATLWVTTPGALSQASLPLHLDSRIVRMGDLVYEQSDLVILDEVETIVDWFDHTFAKKEELTNGGNGLIDRLDTQISSYWNSNRVLPADERRWVIAARESVKTLSAVLTSISDKKQERAVKDWLSHGYFSPNQLAYRLARRLAGLKEWESTSTPPDERDQNTKRAEDAFEPFDELLNRPGDPLRRQISDDPKEVTLADELARLMQTMNNLSDDLDDIDIVALCRNWILKGHPAVEEKLVALRKKLKESNDPFDAEYLKKQVDKSIGELAYRLKFTLSVALLDRHTHIALQEWHNKPEALDAQQPFSSIPRGMRNILPMPLTGQQYGFVGDIIGVGKQAGAENRLSLFAYTNIGRSYLLNFHRLRTDFDGETGPNVLALSGTSYLPDSTAFHVSIPPSGVLLAPKQTEMAISNSRFFWKYFVDHADKPIAVSGELNKEHQLRLLMRAMIEQGGEPGGFIRNVLTWLDDQGQQFPKAWADRGRILMLTNSYAQSEVAADTLRKLWLTEAGSIFNLKRGRENEDYEVEFAEQPGKSLKRIDIEQFAHTGGRILIAPMQSIGRGFNILNAEAEPKAAFGAIFFLTRPMNQPLDMAATAQELSRYALKWADDRKFHAWQTDSLYRKALNARDSAMKLRRMIDHRWGYSYLSKGKDARLGLDPLSDLAASTAGRVVQAVGRLLRGGVPFRAYFIDAAWSPILAATGSRDEKEAVETSLLSAMIDILQEYAHKDEIGKQLYLGLSEALTTTENRDSN